MTIRSFDMKRLDEELRLAHKLYNVTLDRNWGFVPISLEDLLASADDLRRSPIRTSSFSRKLAARRWASC